MGKEATSIRAACGGVLGGHGVYYIMFGTFHSSDFDSVAIQLHLLGSGLAVKKRHKCVGNADEFHAKSGRRQSIVMSR